MGKVTGEAIDVVDLSLKRSHSECSNDVQASSSLCNTSATVAVTISPVIQRHCQQNGMHASLDIVSNWQGDRTDNCTSVAPVTATDAALFSSSVMRTAGGFPVMYSTVSTTADCPPLLRLFVASTPLTTVRTSFSGSTTGSESRQPTLKRRRQATSGSVELLHDSSGSNVDASQRQLSDSSSSSSTRCSSEPLRLCSSDYDDDMHASYVERRRKNNEAAKRSRDARRLKEQHTARRASALQQENVQLRAELAVLRNQAAKLRCLLYNKLGV